MVAALLVAALLGQGGASLKGSGRISVLPGWRSTPNDTFYASSAAQGYPMERPSLGGPSATGVFSYVASDEFEACVDLFVGTESLSLAAHAPITSVSYGALLGVRAQWLGLADATLIPHAGLHAGPSLVYLSSKGFSAPHETLVTAYAISGGLTWRATDRMGVTAEYRFLIARGGIPALGSVNGGGSWLGLGLTVYFPPEQAGLRP